MRTVLATDLAIWPVFEKLHTVSNAMLASNEIKATLANYILLYDQIFILTCNLQILPVLRILLGEDVFDELINNNVIVLSRFDQWLTYIGGGVGLEFFSAHSGDKSKPPNLFNSIFLPLDECINVALKNTNPFSTLERKTTLNNMLLDKVIPVASNINSNTFKNETYKDIQQSPYLRNFLSYKNKDRPLNRLKGIKKNQARLFSPHNTENEDKNPAIYAVLHAAFENFVLGISSELQVDEITGDDSSLALLKAKGQRVGMPIEGINAFTKIQDISGVPDIGLAFANKLITPEQLLDLRESKHAGALRAWLAESDPQDSQDDIVKRYVESIGKPSVVEKLPSKILRYATVTGLGILKPPVGIAASTVDSFILSKWFPVKSPRLFLKHAKSVLVKTEKKTIKTPMQPKTSGRDRNRLCSCGSGKKHKKCCGK